MYFKTQPEPQPKTIPDGRQFVLPWMVLDSASYLVMSYAAKALLVDIGRQYDGTNNGALLCTESFMRQRGWRSHAALNKAKRELLKSNLIHQTVRSWTRSRPCWFALSWLGIDPNPKYDNVAPEMLMGSDVKPSDASRATAPYAARSRPSPGLHEPKLSASPRRRASF
jgi:hypothetical protein